MPKYADRPNGNPDPNRPDNAGKEYSEHTCPYCGETVKKLPAHLPECPDT